MTDTRKKKIFFMDTETSGFIKPTLPADHPEQAWAIQIGGILSDGLGEELKVFNRLIKPEGRGMHPMAMACHGIELSYAQEHGGLEADVANELGIILREADLIVCHNYKFDWGHVKVLLERNEAALSNEARSILYLDIPSFCTMVDKDIKKYVNAKNKAGKLKVPKLIELYEKLFSCEFEGQHDAMADIIATKDCFFELAKLDIIALDNLG